MSQSEVFVPTNGELITRPGPVTGGYSAPMDVFKKERPCSQSSGYRFGQLSQNSFFTRHNPHPNRVRHIKGLLDVPICAVNDNGYVSNPRYSLQFPPNQFDSKQVGKFGSIPVNAINVNSQLHPINTVTGLQYFTGLNSYPWREKAVPRMGLVPVTEAWRDELRRLTDQLGIEGPTEKPSIQRIQERPKTIYSEETGRIIPPPSRAMSRGASRHASRQGRNRAMQHIAAEPDTESMVLSMLCQILQTEDVNAVQAWLSSAGEREKGMVMEMIKSALSNKEDYHKHDFNQEFVEERTILPPINESQKTAKDSAFEKAIDRLVLEEGSGVPGEPNAEMWAKQKPVVADIDAAIMKPPVSEAFKRPPSRPATKAGKEERPGSTFRYTSSAQGQKTPVAQPPPQVTSPNTF